MSHLCLFVFLFGYMSDLEQIFVCALAAPFHRRSGRHSSLYSVGPASSPIPPHLIVKHTSLFPVLSRLRSMSQCKTLLHVALFPWRWVLVMISRDDRRI